MATPPVTTPFTWPADPTGLDPTAPGLPKQTDPLAPANPRPAQYGFRPADAEAIAAELSATRQALATLLAGYNELAARVTALEGTDPQPTTPGQLGISVFPLQLA